LSSAPARPASLEAAGNPAPIGSAPVDFPPADAAAPALASSGLEFILIEKSGSLALPEPPQALPANGFLWVDVHANTGRRWAHEVGRLTGVEIFEEHLLDTENPAHPSSYDSTADYEIIVMRALGPKPAPTVPPRIRIQTWPAVFLVLPRCLVTIHPAGNQLDSQVRERILAASRYNQRLPAQPEELMLRLLSGLVDRYLALRTPLTAQLETWQRNLLNPRRPFKDWTTLLEARMELRKLQHLSEEQLDAIQEWRDERLEHDEPGQGAPAALPPLNQALIVRATDVVEHIHRVLQHARGQESSIDSAVQLHFSATAFRTAEIMRVLTVLTAIFMPLTLITGIFGMNFQALPLADSPRGFWITLAAMGLIGMVMLVVFTVRRYLEAPLPRRVGRRKGDPPVAEDPFEETRTAG
jgi:Mg2+ and Co2+ transporter CorA